MVGPIVKAKTLEDIVMNIKIGPETQTNMYNYKK